MPVLGACNECQASLAPQSVVAVIELIDRQVGGAAPVVGAFDAEDQKIVEVLASLLSVIFSRTSLYDDAVRMHSRADALLTCSTALHAEGVPRHKAMRVMQARHSPLRTVVVHPRPCHQRQPSSALAASSPLPPPQESRRCAADGRSTGGQFGARMRAFLHVPAR